VVLHVVALLTDGWRVYRSASRFSIRRNLSLTQTSTNDRVARLVPRHRVLANHAQCRESQRRDDIERIDPVAAVIHHTDLCATRFDRLNGGVERQPDEVRRHGRANDHLLIIP